MANRAAWIWIIAVTLALPGAAGAVDGVVEISQAAALAGGVTPGDFVGFPITISQPGSYRLTGNLDVRGEADPEDVSAIVISVDDVEIDLNGFAIVGPTVCSGTPLICAPLGGGAGIGTLNHAIAVRNGTIRGAGAYGIQTLGRGTIDSVRVLWSGNSGVFVDHGLVTNSTIVENGGAGIEMNLGSVVSNNLISGNSGVGVIGNQSRIQRNVIQSNAGVGISGPGMSYERNVLYLNNASGPQVQTGIEVGTNQCGLDTTCP